MKKKILFLFLIFCELSFAQEQQMDCATTLIINQNIQMFKIVKYPENFFIKKIENFKSAKNDSPENLMISVLSSSNMEWYNFNKEKKSDKTNQNFKYISESNPDNYYCQLKYKIIFEANGTEYCIPPTNHILHNPQLQLSFA